MCKLQWNILHVSVAWGQIHWQHSTQVSSFSINARICAGLSATDACLTSTAMRTNYCDLSDSSFLYNAMCLHCSSIRSRLYSYDFIVHEHSSVGVTVRCQCFTAVIIFNCHQLNNYGRVCKISCNCENRKLAISTWGSHKRSCTQTHNRGTCNHALAYICQKYV